MPIENELLKGAEIPPFKAGTDYTSNLKYPYLHFPRKQAPRKAGKDLYWF